MPVCRLVAVIGSADADDALAPGAWAFHIAIGRLTLTIATWGFLAALFAFSALARGLGVVLGQGKAFV